ncbi:hypothetical protein [Massilia sp. BJB1822]|uniref:hypothetical protein n=1 Tax=Massilia sp. BJB1822 TaxID=2744470 RepID=UPI0015945093|nr:hypothetical protein [Massilia sp. BJB1822]NVE00818.1 hypothetical protein [Massilia sp. BJB1822]
MKKLPEVASDTVSGNKPFTLPVDVCGKSKPCASKLRIQIVLPEEPMKSKASTLLLPARREVSIENSHGAARAAGMARASSKLTIQHKKTGKDLRINKAPD